MKTRLALGVFFLLSLMACDDETSYQTTMCDRTRNTFENDNRPFRPIVLGDRKQNPFAVDNMKAALDSLLAYPAEAGNCLRSTAALDDIQIEPTDLYVRFLPTDTAQYLELMNDSLLTLFDFPLDYTIIQQGDYYVDPSVSGPYTWLYTRVPVGYTPPEKVTYEVLEELFLYENSDYYSEEVADDSSLLNDPASVMLDALKTIEAVSFFNTGNDYGKVSTGVSIPSGMQKIKRRIKKKFLWHTWYEYEYYPSGTINVQSYHSMDANGGVQNSTTLMTVPVKGIKVFFWNWFRWSSAYTDQNGYYESKENFEGDPSYYIYFTGRHGANTWDFDRVVAWASCLWVQKYGMGEHSNDGYSKTFTTSSDAWDACITNNAFYEYMTVMDVEGLTRPSSNLNVALRNMDGAFSSPLFQNHQNYVNGSILAAFYASTFFAGPGAAVGGVLFNYYLATLPDIILSTGQIDTWQDDERYNNNHYEATNKYISVIWHELAHASNFRRIELSKGTAYASAMWTGLINTEVSKSMLGSPYGEKDGLNWELIALLEGWAYFREMRMGEDYLDDFDAEERDASFFPRDYRVMFRQLETAGCSVGSMERAMLHNKLAEFKSALIGLNPTLKSNIESTISMYD